jgi:beta-lactam-binding protein with PASTA domain
VKKEAAAAGSNAGVPDFVGLSLREAIEKARAMRVKVEMRGNGYVVKQSPAPGSRWDDENVLLLNLQG